jgi:hypothetical protein
MVHISDATNELIDKINKDLQEKCHDLKVNIALYTELNIEYLKLCLFLKDKCVSYIKIDDSDGPSGTYTNLNIESRTNDKYEGMGYNTFLTALTICLARTVAEDHYNSIFAETINEKVMRVLEKYVYTLEIY